MEFRACCVPVAPIRIEPSHRCEMISQLVFGEKAILLETNPDGWQKIKAKYDDYEGWIQKGQLLEIDDRKFSKEDNLLMADWVNEIDFNGYKMYVPIGCSLSAFSSRKAPWNKNIVKYKGREWDTKTAEFSEKLFKQTTFKFLNTPYLWGGKSVFGIDCSGFVQTIMKLFDIAIPRDSGYQAATGEPVHFLPEAKCGDVAFFDDNDGKIIHAGILLGQNEIIHSSGKVRLDKIDDQGIINQETKERTHKLRIIKRFFKN